MLKRCDATSNITAFRSVATICACSSAPWSARVRMPVPAAGLENALRLEEGRALWPGLRVGLEQQRAHISVIQRAGVECLKEVLVSVIHRLPEPGSCSSSHCPSPSRRAVYDKRPMNKAISFALVLVACLAEVGANNSPSWLRYPAISPDGQTLLFEYKGDIWSVPAAGGNAIPLTLSESYEFAPVWSHDGKSVAFASDRYGNFDVFVMPSDGGEAKRLTYHSTREIPSTFTADDRAVLFNATRQDLATHAQFPTGGMSELYSVPGGGGPHLDRADDACAGCHGELDRRQDHLS